MKKAQSTAHELFQEGYSVVIVGEKCHPEVKSIFEWAGGDAVIVDSIEGAEAVVPCARMGIVAQTTFSGAKFKEIVLHLLDKSNDVRIVRTICTATDQRQQQRAAQNGGEQYRATLLLPPGNVSGHGGDN